MSIITIAKQTYNGLNVPPIKISPNGISSKGIDTLMSRVSNKKDTYCILASKGKFKECDKNCKECLFSAMNVESFKTFNEKLSKIDIDNVKCPEEVVIKNRYNADTYIGNMICSSEYNSYKNCGDIDTCAQCILGERNKQLYLIWEKSQPLNTPIHRDTNGITKILGEKINPDIDPNKDENSISTATAVGTSVNEYYSRFSVEPLEELKFNK